MATKTEVFTRKASGLVRVMSPYSAFAYNALAIGILFPWVYLSASIVLPGANIPLGIIITGVLLVPMWLVYSWLSASMPRSGGDYVFQSRIFTGSVGFFVTLMGASFVMYAAFAGWMMNATGIAPMLAVLGFAGGNRGLLGAAEWVSSPTGVIVISLIFLALATWTLIRGMKRYVQLQWVLWYGVLFSLAAMVYLLATTGHQAFIERFNAFYAWAAPGVSAPGGFYQYIIDTATASGLDLHPKFSWVATLGVSTLASNSLVWAVLAVQQLGEIKGANVVKNTNFFIIGSGIFGTAMMALLAGLLFKVAGSDFIMATANAYFTGAIAFPVQPWLGLLASVCGAASPVLVVLVCLGFILNAFQVICNVIIYSVRIIFAAALDGLFPKWVSAVHPKFRAPVNLYIVFLVWIAIWMLLYSLWPPFGLISLSVAAAFCGYFAVTCLAGAAFPYLKKVKGIYEASPITGYRIGKVPWITVLGILGAVVNLVILAYYMLVPALGVYSRLSLIVIASLYVFWLVYYYARRAYMRAKDIDVELAFKQLPPD